MTLPPFGVTRCAIQPGPGKTCFEPAHVVLFATVDGPVGGVAYGKGDRVLSCLEHGGQLYTAMHTHNSKWPAWLSGDPWITLPATRSPYHSDNPRPAPVRRDGSWTPRR